MSPRAHGSQSRPLSARPTPRPTSPTPRPVRVVAATASPMVPPDDWVVSGTEWRRGTINDDETESVDEYSLLSQRLTEQGFAFKRKWVERGLRDRVRAQG